MQKTKEHLYFTFKILGFWAPRNIEAPINTQIGKKFCLGLPPPFCIHPSELIPCCSMWPTRPSSTCAPPRGARLFLCKLYFLHVCLALVVCGYACRRVTSLPLLVLAVAQVASSCQLSDSVARQGGQGWAQHSSIAWTAKQQQSSQAWRKWRWARRPMSNPVPAPPLNTNVANRVLPFPKYFQTPQNQFYMSSHK